jgi:hypothetical protein
MLKRTDASCLDEPSCVSARQSYPQRPVHYVYSFRQSEALSVSVESVGWEGSEERISEERTMGRQRRTHQRRAYDGKATKGAADGHRRGRAESRAYQERACDGLVGRGDLVETSQQFVLWLILTDRASLDLFIFKRTAGVVEVWLGLGPKKKFDALTVDARVLWYGRLHSDGKKCMGC